MRLIDADELIVQFRRAIETFLPNDPRRHMNLGDSLKCHGWEQGLMVIQEAPTIQPTIHPEPHWIPVTKDTPKEAGTYMCTCYDAGRRIVTLAKWQPRTKTWNLTGARAYWKVIAWCKRPEPYNGVTE